MQRRKFLNMPPGSTLHYWTVVQPPGCATLQLTQVVDGTLAETLQGPAVANRENSFGPIPAGQIWVFNLDLAFLGPGVVTVVVNLQQPDGVVHTRPPMVFTRPPVAADAAIVTVTTLETPQ